MRPLPTAIAAAVLALLSACQGATPLAVSAYRTAGLAALLRPQPPIWSTSASPRFDRAAVLIAADSYAGHPEWALPGAVPATDRLAEALTRDCAVSPRSVTRLSGASVHRDGALAALAAAADRLVGPSAVLFVAYVGHGFVTADGDPLLFGHFTAAGEGGGFQNGITRRDVVGAVMSARDRAAARGVVLHVVLVIDACRVGVASPAPRATLREAPLWELWGTRAGTYARAGGEAAGPPFTLALCDAIAVLAKTEAAVDLHRLAAEARARTLAATGGEQEPELLAPHLGAKPPAAVVSTAVPFRISVADAVSTARIDSFTVRLGERTFLAGGEGEVLVQAQSGRQRLVIEADGYLARRDEVEVTVDRAGEVLQVGLHPALVLVSGRVSPPAVVAVRAVGDETLARANYHLLQTVTGRDGVFQLRVPSLADGVQLEFVSGGRVVQTIDLPRQAVQEYASPGLPPVPRVDLDVALVAVADLPPIVASRIDTGQPAAQPRGRDAFAQAQVDRAFDLVSARRFEMARDALAAAELVDADRELGQQWLAWLELQAVPVLPRDRALARLQALGQSGGSEALRLGLAEAILQRLVDRRDWQGVVDLCRQQERGPDADAEHWWSAQQKVLPTALEQVLRAGLVAGVQDGDWTAADGVADWLLDASHLWVLHERPEIQALLDEVDRERVAPACRTLVERADIAFAEGRLEDACELFSAARDGANAHYRARIDERLQELDVRLFEASMRAGTQYEVAGRRSEALAAYARAYARNARASESVRRVLHAGSAADADFTRMYDDLLEHVLERAHTQGTGEAWAEVSRLFADDERARAALRDGLIASWADVVDETAGPSGLPRRVRDRTTGIVLLLVEPGTFMMGAPASDTLATAVERPRHRVTLSRPFYLGETEVTWEAWRRFAAATGLGGTAEAATSRHPVAGVSWREATAFCAYYGLRLPSEAEWEYAARAGNGEVYRRFPWGDDVAKAQGNLHGADEAAGGGDAFPVRDGFVGTAPVGSFAANAWGFHDLLGNVREWCADTFDAAAYRGRAGGVRDPVESGTGSSVVARGASYQDGPRNAGVVTRLEVGRDAHLPWVGLRVARSAW